MGWGDEWNEWKSFEGLDSAKELARDYEAKHLLYIAGVPWLRTTIAAMPRGSLEIWRSTRRDGNNSGLGPGFDSFLERPRLSDLQHHDRDNFVAVSSLSPLNRLISVPVEIQAGEDSDR